MRVRVLSIILVLSLALLQLPSAAFAGGEEEFSSEAEAQLQETLPAEAGEPAPLEETENWAAAEELPADGENGETAGEEKPAETGAEENADPAEAVPPEVPETQDVSGEGEPPAEGEPAGETSAAVEGQIVNAASDSVLSSTAAKHTQVTSPEGYFELLIEADRDVAHPGETITFTVTVYNTGLAKLDFLVNDNISHPGSKPLEQNEIARRRSFSFTETYAVTENELNQKVYAYGVSVWAYDSDSKDIELDRLLPILFLDIDILPDPNNCSHADADKDGLCDACRGELCTVALTSDAGNGTSVSHLVGGGAGIAVIGQSVTISASPVDGYEFCGWYNGDTLVGSDLTCEITLTSTTTELTARFVPVAGLQLEVSANNGYFKVQDALKLSEYAQRLPAGENVTVSYVGDGFLYWVNGSYKIMSRDKDYTFTLVTDTSLRAVAAKGLSDGDVHYAVVIFESEFGQVMQSGTWGSDCSGIPKLPQGPSKLGYTFLYWALEGTNDRATVESICAAIREGTSSLILKPVYAANEERYTVTVMPVIDRTVREADAVQNADLRLGQSVFLRLPLESTNTRTFLCWAADAEGTKVLGYTAACYFPVNGNQTVYAIYGTTAETPDAQPSIALTGYTAFTDGAQHKVSYSISRSVPEGWTLLQHGVLYSVSVFDPADMVLGRENVIQTTSADRLANGIYTLNIGVTGKEDTSIAVRGYLMVKNETTGDQQTLYTEVCTGSWNSLSAGTAAD